MIATRYSLGLVFLAAAGGLIYLGIVERQFALLDMAVTATCLISGLTLIWTAFRMGRVQREERRRRRQYRDRRLARAQNGGPEQTGPRP